MWGREGACGAELVQEEGGKQGNVPHGLGAGALRGSRGCPPGVTAAALAAGGRAGRHAEEAEGDGGRAGQILRGPERCPGEAGAGREEGGGRTYGGQGAERGARTAASPQSSALPTALGTEDGPQIGAGGRGRVGGSWEHGVSARPRGALSHGCRWRSQTPKKDGAARPPPGGAAWAARQLHSPAIVGRPFQENNGASGAGFHRSPGSHVARCPRLSPAGVWWPRGPGPSHPPAPGGSSTRGLPANLLQRNGEEPKAAVPGLALLGCAGSGYRNQDPQILPDPPGGSTARWLCCPSSTVPSSSAALVFLSRILCPDSGLGSGHKMRDKNTAGFGVRAQKTPGWHRRSAGFWHTAGQERGSSTEGSRKCFFSAHFWGDARPRWQRSGVRSQDPRATPRTGSR